jgi:glycerol-3-phosphate dehydrogenase
VEERLALVEGLADELVLLVVEFKDGLLDDFLAGNANLESSYVLGKGKALEAFPMLKSDGLKGAVTWSPTRGR